MDDLSHLRYGIDLLLLIFTITGQVQSPIRVGESGMMFEYQRIWGYSNTILQSIIILVVVPRRRRQCQCQELRLAELSLLLLFLKNEIPFLVGLTGKIAPSGIRNGAGMKEQCARIGSTPAHGFLDFLLHQVGQSDLGTCWFSARSSVTVVVAFVFKISSQKQ